MSLFIAPKLDKNGRRRRQQCHPHKDLLYMTGSLLNLNTYDHRGLQKTKSLINS